VAAIIDQGIADLLEKGNRVDPYVLVSVSVRVARTKIDEYRMTPLAGSDELYRWTLNYDPLFLGYMKPELCTPSSSVSAGSGCDTIWDP